MFDGKAFGEEIVGFVREYLDKEVAPLKIENDALRARCTALEEAAAKPVEFDLAPVEKLIADEIAKLPAPEPAKDVDREELAAIVNDAVAALPPAQDGKSVEIEDVLPVIASEVAKAVEQLPTPKDGKDGTDGQDGSGIADLLRDHEGNLVASFTDGRLKNLGPIQGKDGKDGRDGFQLEDFDCRVLEDDRTIELAFKSGEHEHVATLKWPTVIDRGVYKAGEVYVPGDAVTWGGSLWIAQKETDAKPDTADSGFRLAVKRGRDGKDAKNG